MTNNLAELSKEYDSLREKRRVLNYTGREDLVCMERMSYLRSCVTTELSEIRAKLAVCPLWMLWDLKARETALLEWKRAH